MLVFRGVGEMTEPVDITEEVDEVDALRLLRVRSCWLWVNVSSAGSKSERTSLPATLVLSLRSRLAWRSGGVSGVNE
jgi:hypothetical protein